MTDSLAIEKTPEHLNTFHSSVDHAIVKVYAMSDMASHLKALVEGSKQLQDEINKTGDAAEAYLLQHIHNPIIDSSTKAAYIINYLWSERAKSFMILWRDILFQEQKAQILMYDGNISEHEVEKLLDVSKKTLRQAFQSLKEFPEKEFERLETQKGGFKKQIAQWNLQKNPWPTYRAQIAEIPVQCGLIFQQFEELKIAAQTFEEMRETARETIATCHKEIGNISKTAREVTQFLEENIQPEMEPRPGKIASRLEEIEAELIATNHMAVFTEKIDELDEKLSKKSKIIVDTQQGMLRYKEINLQKKVQDWMESEILPILYEVWEVTENVGNGFKISLINIRNRAILASSETKGGKQSPQRLDISDYSSPLINFLKKTKTAEEGLSVYEAQIFDRLENKFRLKQIFNNTEDFLPIPLASAINQFKINQHEVLGRVENWFLNHWNGLQNFIQSVEQEEALSMSEKVARLIQSRTNSSTNSYYSSIFMTKGYIGESFWVGRTAELKRVSLLIDQWKQGFRGAIAITGQRFAGKTLFGELIANRYFHGNTVRLSPNQTIVIAGRRYTTTYNLAEALSFIKKYTLNTPYMILIDDLEYWWDTTIPLSENVRNLRRYIDNNSSRQFIVVSMSNWLKHHLDQVYDLDKVFQAELNMDGMRVQDIREAILIRHGATHKQLVDKEGREVTPSQFRKLTNQIYKITEGNVGEALNRWTATISRYDEERVVQELKGNYQLPNFITPDNGMLLTALMMEKRTTEYHLRKLFGPPFNDKYRTILQRLISVGLLTRHLDGWLEVNDSAVNDLGRLLEDKGYLKFRHLIAKKLK